MTLRDRCREFITMQHQRAITRTGSPVDDLIGFVLAERGRAMKKTDGERVAQKGWDMPAKKPSDTIANIARLFDRLLVRRKAKWQAEAWDEGMRARVLGYGHDANPYRKGGKR